MFNEQNKGRIIISVESEDSRLNSNMERKGIARKPDIALTTLLINFVSLALEKGKDPQAIIDSSLAELIGIVKSSQNYSDPNA